MKLSGKRRAFSFIELLVVISVMGLLLGGLSTGISSARKGVRVRLTKVFFASIDSALQKYYHTYRAFPQIGDLRAGGIADLSDLETSQSLVLMLTGKNPITGEKTSKMTDPLLKALNPNGLRFYQFQKEYLGKEYLGDDSDIANLRMRVLDGFGNGNIRMAVDHDNDGFIEIPESVRKSNESMIPAFAIFWSVGNSPVYSWR